MRTGLWLFHLKGFNGWNGHTYGMPNISSVQDYEHGPEGAPGRLRLCEHQPVNERLTTMRRRVRRLRAVQQPARRPPASLVVGMLASPVRLRRVSAPSTSCLFCTAQRPGAGAARLVFADSPFGVAVTADGHAATTSRSLRCEASRTIDAGALFGLRRVGSDSGPEAVGSVGTSSRTAPRQWDLSISTSSCWSSRPNRTRLRRRTTGRRSCTGHRPADGSSRCSRSPSFTASH